MSLGYDLEIELLDINTEYGIELAFPKCKPKWEA